MQCIVLPTTGVTPDRRRLLHWCSNFNEKHHNFVGGVVTVYGDKVPKTLSAESDSLASISTAESDSGEGPKKLVSIQSLESVAVLGDESETREQYDWAREEIVCAFNTPVVQLVVFDEIGPEVFHHLGLDAALKACLLEASHDCASNKICFIVADPSVADFLPNLYGDINNNVDWKHFHTFDDFLRADLSPEPQNVERLLFTWNIEYWERYSKETDLLVRDSKPLADKSTAGISFALTRYPVLLLSIGVVLTELVAYLIVRQVVIMTEKMVRKNSSHHRKLKNATHHKTWKRLAKELDMIEMKNSGSIQHVPSLAQFSKSLSGLALQLKLERNKVGLDSQNTSELSIMYTLEDATISCLLEASSSIMEHVNEQLYSSNYCGRNVEFRNYVHNFVAALSEIVLVSRPKSPERIQAWEKLAADFLFNERVRIKDADRIKGFNSKPSTHRLILEHQLSGIGTSDGNMKEDSFDVSKQAIFRELFQRYGESALLLSGGAANAYYHLGVIKCLLEAGQLPRHFSGASGGALVGSFVCTRTDEELRSILQPEKLCKIFDPCEGGFVTMFRNLLKFGTAFDVDVWIDKMKSKITGSMTFKEAYLRTGKTFTITVYNIDAKNHTRDLNYKTAPDVLIYSAVLASSALPKLLPPIELHRKDSNGKIVPYHAFGKFFRDGSFENELPVESLRQHFNVKFTIVSMVEPHISPFFYERHGSAGNVVAHNQGRGWRGGFLLSFMERWIKFDIKKWMELIRDFKLMPKIMQTDMNNLFLGRTRGVVTTAVPIYLKSYLNIVRDPNTPEKFNWYLQVGQKMIFPKLEMIKDHMIIEKRLRELCGTTYSTS